MFRLAFAVLMAAAAPALAQTAPPPPGGDIVITGQKTPDRPAAERYVGAISVRSGDQLARFHQPVCPVVIGLPAFHAAIVQDRIREDAKAVGLAVAKSKCDANLIVMIAGNGAALVKDIRVNRPGWFDGLTAVEIDRLTEPGPARAWGVTSLRNEDGGGLSTPSGSSATLADQPVLRVLSASISALPTRSFLETGFVVIDQDATIGLTLRQVADYAAMRGFARTRPPSGAAAEVGTILTLFDPSASARARELTEVDLAYLHALYRSRGDRAAATERASIVRRISRQK